MAKWRKLPGRGRRGFYVAWLRILVFFKRRLLSFFVFLVVLPTRCLLDVSRLLGLTLRPSAPVCCCHWDSLTRWRPVFVQEAVRVSSSHSPRLVSLQALLKFEVLLREIVFGFSLSLFQVSGSAPDDVCPVTSGACTVLDHLFWVHSGALEKYYVLLRCEFLSLFATIRRTSSRLFRCVVLFVCANMYFPFSDCIL